MLRPFPGYLLNCWDACCLSKQLRLELGAFNYSTLHNFPANACDFVEICMKTHDLLRKEKKVPTKIDEFRCSAFGKFSKNFSQTGLKFVIRAVFTLKQTVPSIPQQTRSETLIFPKTTRDQRLRMFHVD